MWVLAVCIVLLWLFLRPGRYGEAQKQLVYGVNHAHRGLHTKDKTVPENSLPAFRAAAEAGYGVELDIQLSRDGQVVVFHDDTLDRVCGVHGRVDEFTFEELRGMRLCGTQETIPLLTEVFEVMGGRTPMIIELKTGRRNDELCEKGLALMRAYNGPYCIESFDPRIVRWFRKNAKDVLRGQLSDAPASFRDEPKPLAFALGCLFTNVLARPQFIAYGPGKKPWTARLAEAMGAIRVCWTVRPEDDINAKEAENDAVIFEFYHPAPKYKRFCAPFLPFLEKFCPACNFWQGCGVYFIAKAAWCAAAFASITNCKEKQT